MSIIFLLSGVLQIIEFGICLVAVLMVDIVTCWARSNKSEHDESMNTEVLSDSIQMKNYRWISISWPSRYNMALSALTPDSINAADSNSSEIGDFVTRFIPGNWEPVFGF